MTHANTTVSRFQPGVVFNGNYTLIHHLGRGNVGDVWKARHLRVRDLVALKIIRHDRHGQISRMLQEFEVASALRHRNLMGMLARDYLDQQTLYLVMELVVGPTLLEQLRQARRHADPAARALPWARAHGYLEQIVAGLAHAHDRQVVHRDLKPANIFIRNDGVVKIADFGLAKDLDALRELTSTGRGWAGTEAYMAPEQRTGFSVVDQRADLFGLAAIACEMLTGVRFADNGVGALLDRGHVRARLEQRSLALDRDVVRAIMQGLSADPRHRPGSAREFFEPFARVAAESEPTRALPRPRRAPAPEPSSTASLDETTQRWQTPAADDELTHARPDGRTEPVPAPSRQRPSPGARLARRWSSPSRHQLAVAALVLLPCAGLALWFWFWLWLER